jgi:hypothetical protein
MNAPDASTAIKQVDSGAATIDRAGHGFLLEARPDLEQFT